MSRNFLNVFNGDSRFPGIKLLDRPARRLGIELTPRGRPASAYLDVVPHPDVVLVWGRSAPGSYGRPVGDLEVLQFGSLGRLAPVFQATH